ncbi:MAG: hypothetical protein INH41_10090 [Myxococcaceae bacterium]|nr:hypothetical protein [Myxococcaceae bacterium]MCA3012732.1 hypothetical protein [Myxococcaceae bacterium]
MKTWVKFVVAALVLGVLTCGGVIGGAAWWFDANKENLRADGERAKADAEKFARQSDADGCVTEALRRLSASEGLMEEVRVKVFLSECLRRAPRRADFCAGVPDDASLVASTAWSLEFCADETGVDPQACGRLSQAILKACATKVGDAGGASEPAADPAR